MENFDITSVALGAIAVSIIGGVIGAAFNVFPRLRKVENENTQALAHKEEIDRRLDAIERNSKSQSECMVSMKTDIAAIKAMLEAVFNGKKP